MNRRNVREDPSIHSGSTPISRRTLIKSAVALGGASAAAFLLSPVTRASSGAALDVEWIATTRTSPWQKRPRLKAAVETGSADVTVQLDKPLQTIDGFGACFNELGWIALRALSDKDRESIFRELFAPDVGANFTICRMPVGANDFARDWYSYDEVPGDLALKHFSIANDLETLVPFIKNALQHQPGLKLWACPWSPPTWMKTNKHYAGRLPPPGLNTGLRPDQVGKEGTDMFIQEERYFQAYASYFGRFIDEYRKQGIRIGMVMPQNEFNVAQVYPSCTWTPEGLARFISYLGPEMMKRNVALFFGTLERPNVKLLEVSLRDPKASKYIKGAGLQWGAKRVIPIIHWQYPDLKLYQTEQECGDGKNDWRYCRYAWTLMKQYLGNGASAYMYWNISLKKGGFSRWGWAQNSLVTVDPAARTFTYNHEYYLLKHLSHFVKPGARCLQTTSLNGYDNLLAFANPDRSIVIVLQNDLCEELPVRIRVADRVIAPTLPADSFSTVVLRL